MNKNTKFIEVTPEMKERARVEAAKRDKYITHHFEVDHMTGEKRDAVGFYGEFAAREYFGISYADGIRPDYIKIDSGDIVMNGKIIDVKTETVPDDVLDKLLKGEIDDNGRYGRRLINSEQVPLLSHYDYVMWGVFGRGDMSKWYPLGYLPTSEIIGKYKVTKKTPFGSEYPAACLNIHTSKLRSCDKLIEDTKT